MRLPQLDEYRQAVQSPGLVFQDADLRACQPDTDHMRLPFVSSGGFALTFRLLGQHKQWAVRCFHKPVPDRQRRYAAISRFLNSNRNPIFTDIHYLPQGIRVNEQWYPVTKMRWLPGETLSKFIEGNITRPQALDGLSGQFQKLVAALERIGVAHGDLQHGNIMVSEGKLMLIDYDGMYVPGLAGSTSSELGHVNYQHPARTEKEFGILLDRFSAIVIYLALRALALASNPSDLWQKYSTGENLLFTQEDFRSPDNSELLGRLSTLPGFQPLVNRFRLVCKGSVAQTPSLTDFLAGRMIAGAAPVDWIPAPARRQYQVIDAMQRDVLLQNVGQRVTVVGRIADYTRRTTQYGTPGKPYVFLSFGNWRQGSFRLVIWSEGLGLFDARKIEPSAYTGKWVSVTGLLTRYDPDNRPSHPQIVVEMPSEIEILKGGEKEARGRLSTRPGSKQPPAQTPPAPLPSASIPQSRRPKPVALTISDLYKNWPASPIPTKPKKTALPRTLLRSVKPQAKPVQPSPKSAPQTVSGPRLSVAPAQVDFGCVEKAPLPTTLLDFHNAGNDTLEVKVTSDESWLVMEETDFKLAPKESKSIVLRLRPDHPVKLALAPIKQRKLTATIEINSNGGKARVPVELVTKYHG
jgi:serine/threonine protein kinase